ncbi:hypothetical protein LX36DRAFT_17357 [Colletotrichum falcatum]|nr:hypothetical protein LX36DRAFT_17357 [Colletotrichum falcatum]
MIRAKTVWARVTALFSGWPLGGAACDWQSGCTSAVGRFLCERVCRCVTLLVPGRLQSQPFRMRVE